MCIDLVKGRTWLNSLKTTAKCGIIWLCHISPFRISHLPNFPPPPRYTLHHHAHTAHLAHCVVHALQSAHSSHCEEHTGHSAHCTLHTLHIARRRCTLHKLRALNMGHCATTWSVHSAQCTWRGLQTADHTLHVVCAIRYTL